MKQRTEKHRNGRGEDQSRDTGTDAAQCRSDSRIFQKILNERCNNENNEERGKNDAECCQKLACNAGLCRTDKGRDVDGDRPGSGLRHRNQIENLLFCQPAV